MKPYILEPIPDYTIWGNDKLSTFRHADKNYGTWWEVSAHPYCTNPVRDAGCTLQALIDSDPEAMLGKGVTMHEMLRVAFLDAKDALSIQVHPFDAYAMEHANDFGKDESWYIIDAEPGAKLVAGTTTDDPATLKKAVEDGTLENYLSYQEVKPGDYIDIPAGMLHALGAGILAIEVGTNSNVTYRFYDYNRKNADGSQRPLHLKESFDVANFALRPTFVPAQNTTRRIGDTPHYVVDEIFADKDVDIAGNGVYFLLSNLGEDTTLVVDGVEYPFKKYESAFVPASLSHVTIKQGAHVLYSQTKGN